MTEPMTETRLAEIRMFLAGWTLHCGHREPERIVRDLLVEVERLQAKINDSCPWCVYESPKPLMCHCESACGHGNCLWNVRTREGRLAAAAQRFPPTRTGG